MGRNLDLVAATKKSAALAAELGHGWQPKPWQDTTTKWHPGARKGEFEVCATSKEPAYTAWYLGSDQVGDEYVSASSPCESLDSIVALVRCLITRRYTKKLQGHLDALTKDAPND